MVRRGVTRHYRHAAARHHTSCSLSIDTTFQKSCISLSSKFSSSCIKRKINLHFWHVQNVWKCYKCQTSKCFNLYETDLNAKSELFWLSMDKCYQANTGRPAYDSRTIQQYILDTGIWSPKLKKVKTPLWIPKYHVQRKFSDMTCNTYVTLDGKQAPSTSQEHRIGVNTGQTLQIWPNEVAITWNAEYDTKGKIWQCQHSTVPHFFLEHEWNRNITNFHQKLSKRYRIEKSKKNEQTVKRKTFNVTYSSSGGSAVTPQLKEKIHTTEKRVKMINFDSSFKQPVNIVVLRLIAQDDGSDLESRNVGF